MNKKKGKVKKLHALLLIILFINVFVLGFEIGMRTNRVTITYYNETKAEIVPVAFIPYNVSDDSSFSSIIIPAVDDEKNGIATFLTVQVTPGHGRILVNIDKLLFWTDTQHSIRTATKVASNITGVNLSKYDIIYTLTTNATAVEGSSAGAAITIATIAALRHERLKQDVMITGAINHDGTIGPVGDILPKAKLAKSVGAKILLVPLLQSHETTYKTRKYCEQLGYSEICTIEKIPEKIDIGKEAGINVIEVKDIGEALQYFE